MLTEEDVNWIKENRKETTRNRTHLITLYGESKTGEHPITGEPIAEEIEVPVNALVTEITSAFKMDINVVAGVEVEKGDLWVVIDLDEFEGDRMEYTKINPSEVKTIEYYGEIFRVLAADREGLGRHNRITAVARLVS